MARIRNLGEMNPLILTNDLLTDFHMITFMVKLDQPIEIDKEFLSSISEVTGEQVDLEFSAMAYSAIGISDGAFERNFDHCKPAERALYERARALLPQKLIKVFLDQGAYVHIGLSLLCDDVLRPGATENRLCDLVIDVAVSNRIENQDRFLQAFARKLNKWLSEKN